MCIRDSLSAVTHDIKQIKRDFYKAKGEALVKALKKTFFEAYYVETKAVSYTHLDVYKRQE